MGSRIRTRKNFTAGQVPQSGDLNAGELAINVGDFRVWSAKDDGTVGQVVHPNRQLEAAFNYGNGDAVFGVAGARKIFRHDVLGFEASAGGSQVRFPNTEGRVNQVLKLDGTLARLVWADAPLPENLFYTIPIGTGSDLYDDFNEVDWTATESSSDAIPTAFQLRVGQTAYFTFERTGLTYIFLGDRGISYGLGGTLLTDNSLFIPLGSTVATQPDYDSGTVGAVTDTALANRNYLLKSGSGDSGALQVLAGTGGYQVAANADLELAAGGGAFAINRSFTAGAAGARVTGTMAGTLRGVDLDLDTLRLTSVTLDAGLDAEINRVQTRRSLTSGAPPASLQPGEFYAALDQTGAVDLYMGDAAGTPVILNPAPTPVGGVELDYRWSDNTAVSDPGQGRVKVNGDQNPDSGGTVATVLSINHTTDPGNDFTVFWDTVKAGDYIGLFESGAGGGERFYWLVTDRQDNGTWSAFSGEAQFYGGTDIDADRETTVFYIPNPLDRSVVENPVAGQSQTISVAAVADHTLSLRALAGQTGDLLRFLDSTGTVKAAIDPGGEARGLVIDMGEY